MSSEMTMMIRLHPVSGIEMPGIGGTELLHKECTERPDLDLHFKSSNDDGTRNVKQRPSIVSLGKNSFTMIADPTLPRNAVDVVVELCDDDNDETATNDHTEGMGICETIRLLSDSSTFSFEQPPSISTGGSPTTIQKQPKLRLRIQRYIAGFVAINNEIVNAPNAIIKEGDILSLQSMSYSYDYVVMLTPISDSTTSATATTTNGSKTLPLSVSPSDNDLEEAMDIPPTAVPADQQQQQQHDYIGVVDQQQKLMQQMVDDEFTCAICLEYQVQSTALVPCGHSFCNTCIFDPTKKKLKHKVCSVCNTKITSVVPNRTIDSCFHLIVQFQTEQNKKPSETDDEQYPSSLASILPQEDFDHYVKRSEEQMNVRMNTDTSKRGKRQRPTHDAVRPLPFLPPNNPNEQIDRDRYHTFALFPLPDVGIDDDDDDDDYNRDTARLHANALYYTNRFFPRTPVVATNGGQPATVSLIHGTTPSDAIEID